MHQSAEDRPFWQRRRLRVWALLALIAVVGVGLALRARHPAPTDSAAGSAPLVSIIVPGKVPVTSTIRFTGAIAARYDMPIGVEGEGGRIAAVLVEAGDRVRQGQPLARLDTSVIASQVASLQAQLEQARADAVLAESDLRRAEAVAGTAGAMSQAEVDRRRALVTSGNARAKAAAAQLAEAQARLSRAEIRAPADGVVLTRSAEVGQTAMPGGAVLFRLARGAEVEMRAQVAEQDLPVLRVGQPASVRITGVAPAFPGKVRLIGAVIDPQTRLGDVRIALRPDPSLRPGAFARGEVVTGNAARTVLPQTAVLSDGAVNYVLLVGAGDKVERRVVTVAEMRPEGVVLEGGLQGTERVVATAGAFLREGEVVRAAQRQPGT